MARRYHTDSLIRMGSRTCPLEVSHITYKVWITIMTRHARTVYTCSNCLCPLNEKYPRMLGQSYLPIVVFITKMQSLPMLPSKPIYRHYPMGDMGRNGFTSSTTLFYPVRSNGSHFLGAIFTKCNWDLEQDLAATVPSFWA